MSRSLSGGTATSAELSPVDWEYSRDFSHEVRMQLLESRMSS